MHSIQYSFTSNKVQVVPLTAAVRLLVETARIEQEAPTAVQVAWYHPTASGEKIYNEFNFFFSTTELQLE